MIKDYKDVLKDQVDCCCGPSLKQLASSITTFEVLPKKGEKPKAIPIDSEITISDRFGAIKSRWGVGRMNYMVTPGLYALGEPDESSEVLVTANYKLTFDKLRSLLKGRNFWILVLNTYGINVWCAAGKGTFGTDELVRKIEDYNLSLVVKHKSVIVPQLGAPGVAGYEVKKRTGFKVYFGPIRAEDIGDYLDSGRKATPEMRRKSFSLRERTVLIPVELVTALKYILLLQLVFFFASGLGDPEGYLAGIMTSGLMAVAALTAALIGGAVLTPILLPYLPGRSFSIKSMPLSLVLTAVVVYLFGSNLDHWSGRLETGAWVLIIGAITAFLAMNFTGASTYTSLSGVKKEMKIAVPLQIGAASIGLVLWIVSRVLNGVGGTA